MKTTMRITVGETNHFYVEGDNIEKCLEFIAKHSYRREFEEV